MKPEIVSATPGSLSKSYSIDQKQPPAKVATSKPAGILAGAEMGGALSVG